MLGALLRSFDDKHIKSKRNELRSWINLTQKIVYI